MVDDDDGGVIPSWKKGGAEMGQRPTRFIGPGDLSVNPPEKTIFKLIQCY